MNLELNHETPLVEILENATLADLVRLCGSNPAFLAAIVKAHTQNHAHQ